MSVRGDRQKQQGSLLGILQGLMSPGSTLSGDAAIDRQRMLPPGRKAQLLEAAGLQPQPDTQFPTAELLTGLAGGPTRSLGGGQGSGQYLRTGSDRTPTSQIPIVQDVVGLAKGIAERQARTAANLKAQDAARKSDLSAFGGFGGDATGLEPFGGSGRFIQDDLQSIAASLAESGVRDTPEFLGAPDPLEPFGGAGANVSGAEKKQQKATDPLEPFGGAGPDVDNLPTKEEQDDILEETFSKSMKDYLDALKGEDTDVKSIEEYKKEFADATGISIDGKPDKSAALMSFGLALMQNKAGKGFNIGRMLSAVGEAGEKAMPAFQQAKKEAKAEQLAAGKYALDSRAAALTKAAATRQAIADRVAALSDRAYDRETQVQLEELKQDGQNLRKEAELVATAQRKAVEDAEKAGELGKATKLLVGGFDKNKFEVQGQQVGTSDVFKIINPNGAMRTVDGMIKGSSKGLDISKKMKEIAASGEVSGYKDLFNRFQLGAQGLFSVPFDGKVDNATAEYKAAVGTMLIQFRKLLTGGEAGNAISDRDVDIIKGNLGYIEDALLGNLTTSSEEIIARINNLEGMFQDRLDMHSAFKTNLIEIGQKAGQYQEYDLGEDSDFTDDFAGYTSKVMPSGRIRYSLINKG